MEYVIKVNSFWPTQYSKQDLLLLLFKSDFSKYFIYIKNTEQYILLAPNDLDMPLVNMNANMTQFWFVSPNKKYFLKF